MPKTYPSAIHNFIVAEFVRPEAGGKTTIIGAFSIGKIILLENTPLPALIPLGLFVAFKDGEGTFQGKVRITDPNAKELVSGVLGSVVKEPNQGMQFAINFSTLPLVATGDYLVDVMLDDRIYQEHFSVAFASSRNSQHL